MLPSGTSRDRSPCSSLRRLSLAPSSMGDAATPSSLTASTNWVVSHGSLDDSISFDSSLSPEDDGRAESLECPLLVLSPPESTESSHPCEITVRFQNHFEVLQIYVKSTAKIYEIYYASDTHSANEYLCTVRCGIAALDDDEAVHDSDSREKPEHNENGDNWSVKDGWVEVKNPPSSFTDASADSKMCGNNESTSKINQNKLLDYYEATAEITDADPCVSVTLRLLSLEVKGCVQIKVIYIFANPVESSGSLPDMQSRNETSSSLLSMLVPSILHSSRLGPQFVQDWKDLNPAGIEKQKERTEPVLTESGKEQEVRPRTENDRKGINQEPICKRTEMDQFETTTKSAVSEEKHFDLANIERALYHLDYRMSRMEAFVLKFEENILHPVNIIEGRLHGLEQKLDSLLIRSKPTKIVAPEFSYDESRESSFDEEKSTNQAQDASQASKVSHLETSEPPDLSLYGRCFSDPADQFQPHSFAAGEFVNDKSEFLCNSQEPSSSIDPKGSPTKASLVMTAPDFSSDDEYISVNETLELLKGSLGKKPSVSINDALASALEGFLSSTSASLSKAGPDLAVRASEFESEATTCNDATFFPPTTLLSEQPGNLLPTNEGDSLVCPSCVSDELNEETVRISRGPLSSIETAGAVVLGSCFQSLDNGESLSENFEYDSTPCTIVSISDTAIESHMMHSGTIVAADSIAAQRDVVPDLASPKDQEGTHILFPDDSSSVVGELDIIESMVATFEQLISDGQLARTVYDDGSSLELGKISLNLDSDVLDFKFISHEDGFVDAPLEDLLGCTDCPGESASEGNDEHKVLEPVPDGFLVQEVDGEVNENEPDNELFVNVGSVTLESVVYFDGRNFGTRIGSQE